MTEARARSEAPRPLTRVSGGRPPSTEALAVGTRIARRFRVLGVLGVGGMGSVYDAEDERMGRRVAVKVLRPEYAADPRSARRFEREARAASLVDSPRVVTLFDFGEDESGSLYMVMERLSGESLAPLLAREGALPVGEAVAIGLAVTEALAAAHRGGVVHRDLKPDNVFLLEGGGLKVVDFGIAHVLEDLSGVRDRRLTQADVILGTPLYMSPEAIRRAPVGPGADLYALGVMMFELLAGRPPFDALEPVVLLGKHLEEPPPSLEALDPSLPRALTSLVTRLLAKDPGARLPSADAVHDALLALALQPSPALPRPLRRIDGPQRRSATIVVRPPRPRRRLGVALGVTATLFGALGWLALAHVRAPDAPPDPAERRVSQVAPPPLTPPPARVHISVRGVPTGATLRWDGEPTGAEVDARADTLPHRLELALPGQEPVVVEVVPDADRVVVLEPRPVPPAPSSAPRSPTERRRTPRLRAW